MVLPGIAYLEIPNQEVYNFLKDKENLGEWIKKALTIGCIGLKQMVLTET